MKMALKTYKPTTPSLRQLVIVDRSGLWKGKPVKALTEGKSETGGRNNHGRITSEPSRRRSQAAPTAWSTSSAASSAWRRRSSGWSTIPTASAFIALIKYTDGELAYILAPQRLKAGDEVMSGERVDIKPGNAMPLANMPVGTIVHNVEMKPGRGGQIARSAGTYVQLVGKDAGYAQLKLTSGEVRLVRGRVHGHGRRGHQPGPPEHLTGKAGRTRWLGRRPVNSRRRHEPGRPSARRRRRPHLGRPSSGHPVGQADQGQEDPQEQGDGQVHRPSPSRDAVGG